MAVPEICVPAACHSWSGTGTRLVIRGKPLLSLLAFASTGGQAPGVRPGQKSFRMARFVEYLPDERGQHNRCEIRAF